LMFKVP